MPTLQPRTGPAGVAQFFAAVGELEIHDFQVLDILASERQVAAEVMIDFSTPAGGRWPALCVTGAMFRNLDLVRADEL